MSRINWAQAAGESLLIVIGVGFALGADAWWEERAERRAEHEYLVALDDELTSLRAYARTTIREAEQIRGAGGDLLRVSAAWPDAGAPTDSVSELIAGLGEELVWLPPLAVYEDLINTGAVQLIRSDDVRRGLADVVEASDWIADRAIRHNQFFWDHVEPYLRREIPLPAVFDYAGLPPPPDPWEPGDFLASLELRNLVAAKVLSALDVASGAEDLLLVIDRVLPVVAEAVGER